MVFSTLAFTDLVVEKVLLCVRSRPGTLEKLHSSYEAATAGPCCEPCPSRVWNVRSLVLMKGLDPAHAVWPLKPWGILWCTPAPSHAGDQAGKILSGFGNSRSQVDSVGQLTSHGICLSQRPSSRRGGPSELVEDRPALCFWPPVARASSPGARGLPSQGHPGFSHPAPSPSGLHPADPAGPWPQVTVHTNLKGSWPPAGCLWSVFSHCHGVA